MSDNRIDIGSVGKFDGKNYYQWKFKLCCALQAKGLFGISKGTEVRPVTEGNEQKKWIKDDAYIMFLLTSAMDYSQITLIENCQSSKQIIDKLDAIYEQKTEMNKMIAHEKFLQYKMDRLLDEDASLNASDSSEVALAASSNVDKKNTHEENKQRPKLDKSKIICYKYQKKRHFTKECRGERK
ncbi:uncharacterized protein LOC118645761 [Monomorium pharaonis]|uniref:uncharacterized protein LOC118645761 n=1 Tax=Monomorium pharaonis TaxID=307658 RepID=UPI0017466491|nr:uncharacterized protein LOC118645761 [Monomorium pharaonis]